MGETLFGLIDAAATSRARRAPGGTCCRWWAPERGPPDWPQTAYGVYNLYNGMNFAVRAVRNERFKYVWNPQDIDELYDLQADPHEMTNLAEEPVQAATQAELREQLTDWLAQIGDDLPSRTDLLPPAGTIMATGEAGP